MKVKSVTIAINIAITTEDGAKDAKMSLAGERCTTFEDDSTNVEVLNMGEVFFHTMETIQTWGHHVIDEVTGQNKTDF